jgi:hypothetical protein
MSLNNPKKIAERGERIYQDRYKEAFEREHPGKFVAIDVDTGDYYLGDFPEQVLEQARKGSQTGIFHLVKIGSPGAFRVSYTSDGGLDWIFR